MNPSLFEKHWLGNHNLNAESGIFKPGFAID
jgi:hypothetical protein